jgi:hypothetical protein
MRVVNNKAWTAGVAAVAVALGLGVAGVVPAGYSSTVAGSARPAPTPAPAPGDRAGGGGALPVVPVGGSGCIAGLNCGCIRYITCPGTVRHRPAPATVNNRPPDAPGAADPGGG